MKESLPRRGAPHLAERRALSRSLLLQGQPAVPVLRRVVRLAALALHAQEVELHRGAGAAVIAKDLQGHREGRERGSASSARIETGTMSTRSLHVTFPHHSPPLGLAPDPARVPSALYCQELRGTAP